ncbi:hypothetical protein OF829_09455 [Sphingomonas sp. LB-2]|uniref:hypothetical protein n=1 Tax=Sphingomonas caeni TaxID=2984949 RepID=UPI00223278F8|nr:hypothetical protein [Sphingomonas caeni]MCW3847468.1 hypothetical protein [Sphingomonas caeni]
MPIHCPNCGELNTDYSASHCRCGYFLGWPNHRKALSEQPDLAGRYAGACQDLHARGLSALIPPLESLAANTLPAITMPCEACDDLLMGKKYHNYYSRIDFGARFPAAEVDHADRAGVNQRLYPGYANRLIYAQLSPDGRGLPNYGEVTVIWNIDPNYLGIRTSLLEENEYRFVENHGLGALGSVVPPGFRAIWDDRIKLVVAKLASALTSATTVADLPHLLLAPGATRQDDVFVEAVIYGDPGIDARDVKSVHLEQILTDRVKRMRWDIVLELCTMRGIMVV